MHWKRLLRLYYDGALLGVQEPTSNLKMDLVTTYMNTAEDADHEVSPSHRRIAHVRYLEAWGQPKNVPILMPLCLYQRKFDTKFTWSAHY